MKIENVEEDTMRKSIFGKALAAVAVAFVVFGVSSVVSAATSILRNR